MTKEMQIKPPKEEKKLSQDVFQESFIANSLTEYFKLINYHKHFEYF